jgi:hypothetical protein
MIAVYQHSISALLTATIRFQPCDSRGRPISYRISNGGQSSFQPVTTSVRGGAFSINLADTTLTSPPNIAYAVTVVDNASGNVLLGTQGYLIQPSSSGMGFR